MVIAKETCPGRHAWKVRLEKETKTLQRLIPIFSALMKIHRKGVHLLDQFQILSARDEDLDREIASIQQKMTFFKHSYNIYSIYGEYQMKGLDIFDHAFTLADKNEKTIAIVNKKFFSMADTYGVEMIDSNIGTDQVDHAFILALILVLHCSLYCS